MLTTDHILTVMDEYLMKITEQNIMRNTVYYILQNTVVTSFLVYGMQLMNLHQLHYVHQILYSGVQNTVANTVCGSMDNPGCLG